MMYKLVANIVWSIRAKRSTPAQARNICGRQFTLLWQRWGTDTLP